MIKLSENLVPTIFRLITIFIVIKAIMVALLFVLPKSGVDKIVVSDLSLPYIRFDVKSAFFTTKIKKSKPKPQKPLYKLDNLELTGVYMESQKSGYVVFYDKKDKKQHILTIGEEYKGYKLDSLSKYKAIFSRDNKLYKLTFKKDSKVPIEIEDILEPDKPVRMVPKRLIKKYSTDFRAIWKNIAIKEVVKNGKITGFKINHIKKGSVFDELGLKKGDIIVEVNNKPMRSYKAAFDIYRNINKISDLNIKVLRDNEIKEFNYEVY